MKKLILFVVNMLLTTSLFAQTGSIVGRVIDKTNSTGVIGAIVEIASIKDANIKKYFTTGYDGTVKIDGIAYGDYLLTLSYMGYENSTKEIKISSTTNNIGTLTMQESAVKMETVVKEAQALRASQKGDTISYNASAFKVSNDSDVEGLLKKMPGISIINGEVEAQGETVKKIYVDGKEFFGDDVSTAIKTLPAEAVDRIEVYNKLSDAAEFSGVDDGEGNKAINIVTHKHMRNGVFGKVSAGYGYDAESNSDGKHKYIAGGNINIFKDKSRTSILALTNNVNEQNFSFEDVIGASAGSTSRGGASNFMVRPQSGIATVNAIGINHSNSWGEKDKLKFQGSYFFNNTNTENNTTTEKWFEDPSPTDTLINIGVSNIMNYNHRFNSKIEWKISDKQELMIRPSFSFQSNTPTSTTDGHRFGESGNNIIKNKSDKDVSKYNARLSAVYRLRLGKPGRTLTFDASGSYSSGKSEQYSYTNKAPRNRNPDPGNDNYDDYKDYDYPDTELYYQLQDVPTISNYLSGRVTYTEPLSKGSQLNIRYNVSNEYQEMDKMVYASELGFEDIGHGTINTRLSNSYESTYLIHKVGPGYRFVKDKNYFGASLYYEYSQLDGQVIRTDSKAVEHSYNNFTYFLMGNLQLNRENTLKIFLRSYTKNPSLSVLQDVYNLSNLQNISKGNPNLDASYSHSLRFHYINTNIEKGRTFMAMFSVNNTSNYIGKNVEYNKIIEIDGEEYAPFQYSEPVNLDGYMNIRSRLSYGFPVNFIKCNLNLSAGINYTNTPSMVDSKLNDASTIGYTGGAILGSNISENIDFTFDWHGTYNETNNSLSTSSEANKYFNHTASGSLRVIFWKGLTLSAAASYTQYIGYTNDYEDSYILCSAWLGKQFLKSKRAEVSIGVNDIFNQNQGFVRSTGSGWTQNAINSVMGRYYMLRFTYNLRSFGGKQQKSDGLRKGPRGGGGGGGRHHGLY